MIPWASISIELGCLLFALFSGRGDEYDALDNCDALKTHENMTAEHWEESARLTVIITFREFL